ncbi:Uncharacterised protein [Mycobacteroides abscessus subsp. abscessus]|uniref:hypothetical protein n=1 Tax=Mycobacteroides abscessus TaxID=36809 RepID=UPI000925FCA5|nr:hypothetical protein [Mycobacteroides abscessus]SID31742.1 Uncharacterised protein [Mycobacteroides abscessus subsp. abscessus]SID68673.1 Uncharacterised protein [Mycobacteroides abscessus subsp. abscessus]SKG38698.1 Uncharacterised protein [Mycobacteroides abscessus subsp. abscessus]SKQ80470.1 Uncharacterised protein [Mycobacteroides abscessus subsp. abscessus]
MADAHVSRVRDAIWNELERQAARFGHVDRVHSIIDMNSIELDMDKVAAAAIRAVRTQQPALGVRRFQWWHRLHGHQTRMRRDLIAVPSAWECVDCGICIGWL